MKIAEINSVSFGSTGTIMHDVASLAIQQGHIVRCFIPKTKANVSKLKPNDVLYGSYILRNLSRRLAYLTGLHNIFFLNSTTSLIKELNRFEPDLIHLHNLHAHYLNIPILFRYLKRKGIPVVWTLHDCWAYTGHCPHYTLIRCEKWKTCCYNCPLYSKYPSCAVDDSKRMYKIKKRWFSGLDNLTIVTVSKWLELEVRKSFLRNMDILTIHNGIDTNIFKPTSSDATINKYGLTGIKYVIGVASVWSNNKGLSDYIKLSKILSNDFKIVLVGVNELQKQQLAAANIVGILNTSNIDELVALYSGAKVVLNLSYEESFGLTTVEGYSCGRPGVVFDSTASPELVSSFEYGRAVRQGDIEAVCSAIYELSSISDVVLIKECRNRALELYDKEKTYHQYSELFNSKLDRYKYK